MTSISLRSLSTHEFVGVVDRKALVRSEFLKRLAEQGYRPMPDWLVDAYKVTTGFLATCIGVSSDFIEDVCGHKFTLTAFAVIGGIVGALPGLIAFDFVAATLFGIAGATIAVAACFAVSLGAMELRNIFYDSEWEITTWRGHMMGRTPPAAITALVEEIQQGMPGVEIWVERFMYDPFITLSPKNEPDIRVRVAFYDWWGHYISRT